MEERKYLKWYNKVGYGSGDIAGNVVYAFLTSFVMIYLTDTIGLNAGIVGTLIAVSKLFDGVSDIFFGSMIDGTKITANANKYSWVWKKSCEKNRVKRYLPKANATTRLSRIG